MKPTKKIMTRFWKKVAVRSNGCWEWTSFKDAGGYGRFQIKNRNCSAHRLSYTWFKGPLENQCCHHCDNRACVNPAHLYDATQKQNMQDCAARGRLNSRQGVTAFKAKLTEKQVTEIFQSTDRQCDLAKKYGVSKHAIYCIRIGKSWVHVTKNL